MTKTQNSTETPPTRDASVSSQASYRILFGVNKSACSDCSIWIWHWQAKPFQSKIYQKVVTLVYFLEQVRKQCQQQQLKRTFPIRAYLSVQWRHPPNSWHHFIISATVEWTVGVIREWNSSSDANWSTGPKSWWEGQKRVLILRRWCDSLNWVLYCITYKYMSPTRNS